MARDAGLEDLLTEDLAETRGLTTRAMFGGLAWLHDGRLLCAVRRDGMLVRLGPEGDRRVGAGTGVAPMRSGARPMRGWFWVDAAAMGEDGPRRRLLAAALLFVRSLPPKSAPLPLVPWDFPDTPGAVHARPSHPIKA